MEDDHKSSEEVDKLDHEVMLPGFRFHPTDEELVGFYLKMKIQQRLLPIELIKQVDIYKYDPWDLPNLAPSGEKEWYFYCPRDRKYKNSARPNRVTGAGFWKATGTDRPIYSSDGAKCIGLKKSLVFYRGRAAKGIKTDWMMHEFRLPSSIIEPQQMNKKIQDKNIPLNDGWAICRIFKKTNSMAQRGLSHSWVSSLTEDKTSTGFLNPFISRENMSCTTDDTLSNLIKPTSTYAFSGLETPSYRPTNQTTCKPSPFPLPYADFPTGFVFLGNRMPEPATNVGSLFLNHENRNKNCENIGYEGEQQAYLHNFSMNSYRDHELGNIRTHGFPFDLPETEGADEWKLNMDWDSPPCPSESTTYSNNVIIDQK